MKGVSLSTSIIGEWYLSFGWIAVVFGGWLHGRLARTVNVLREIAEYRTNPIVYGLAVMVLVSGMRSMLELVHDELRAGRVVGRQPPDARRARSPRRRVKLLHVVASYLPAVRYGGTIVSVHGLCRALAARGHDVHVYTTSVDGPRDSAVPHGEPVDDRRRQGLVLPLQSVAARCIARRRCSRRSRRTSPSSTSCTRTRSILWPLWAAARAARARRRAVRGVASRHARERDLIEQQEPALKGLLDRGRSSGATSNAPRRSTSPASARRRRPPRSDSRCRSCARFRTASTLDARRRASGVAGD